MDQKFTLLEDDAIEPYVLAVKKPDEAAAPAADAPEEGAAAAPAGETMDTAS